MCIRRVLVIYRWNMAPNAARSLNPKPKFFHFLQSWQQCQNLHLFESAIWLILLLVIKLASAEWIGVLCFGRWNPPCLWSLDPPRETLRVRRRLRSCLPRSSEHVRRDEFLFAIFEGLAETMRPQTILARPLVPMSVSFFMRWALHVLRLFSLFWYKMVTIQVEKIKFFNLVVSSLTGDSSVICMWIWTHLWICACRDE